MNKKLNLSLKDALIKKAMGYTAEETVDELAPEPFTGELKIVKRKVTTKHIPPDLTAAKLLFEVTGDKTFDLSALSDEQLLAEKNRLEKLREKNAQKMQ